VRHEHGRSPEHVAEGVVQEVQDGGGVQVGVPEMIKFNQGFSKTRAKGTSASRADFKRLQIK
jgi:hypothetical protein